MPAHRNTKVVLVGWDGADWNIIHPLLDAGLLPNLRGVVENGVMGSIQSLAPILSPMLWTSIATGKRPEAHGVLGFLEPDPLTGGVRPVSSRTRKAKALWNILNQSGLRSHVVGWFASHPAEPVRGVYVSNAFQEPPVEKPGLWPLAPGAVHPASLEQELSNLRVHPAEITGDDLLPFIPNLAEIDQDQDRRPQALAGYLAANATVHAAFTWALEHQPWDFAAVYYDLIDHTCHDFMAYYPPKSNLTPDRDFRLYHGVVSSAYRFQDMILGRIIELAGEGAVVMVVSDHGFMTEGLRPQGVIADVQPETPALWHRTHGMFCAAGPGLREDELVYGAGLLDVTPTILAMFGLPAGEDMPGRVLAEAFENPPSVGRIPSWEEVPGDAGLLPPGSDGDAWDAEAAIRQLADLGYVDAPSESASQQIRIARLHETFNLGRSLLAAGRPADAIPHFEQAAAELPETATFKLFLAQAYFAAGRLADCRATAESLLTSGRDRPWFNMLLGNLALVEGRPEDALEHLSKAEATVAPNAALNELIGRTYSLMERWTDAERAFRSAIDLDSQHAGAHADLALALLRLHRSREAAEAALSAVGLRYDVAGHHLLLGAALAAIGRTERAIEAFETCLKLRPDTPSATQWLTRVRRRAEAEPAREQGNPVDTHPGA